MNDKTKLVKEAKKTTKQVVVVGPPVKKRLGKMGLGEMLPNLRDQPLTRGTERCKLRGVIESRSR